MNCSVRSGGSLRMQRRIAVEAATGSGEKRMSRKPIMAFQNPITTHGSVTANITTRMKSTTLNPPGESAMQASQTSPAMVRPTTVKNHILRMVRTCEDVAVAAPYWIGWSSMKGFSRLLWSQMRVRQDIAEVTRRGNLLKDA